MNWIELASSMATVAAAITAVLGINAWRREHVGRRRIDLAEEVLALVYEAQDVFEWSRLEITHQGDGSTRNASVDETPQEKALLDSAFIPIERCNERMDLFAKLRSLRYRLMAQHGRESSKWFDELDSVRREPRKAFIRLSVKVRNLRRHRVGTHAGEYQKMLEKLAQDWWDERASEFDSDGNDLVLQRFNDAVSRLEEHCRQVIGDQGNRNRVLPSE